MPIFIAAVDEKGPAYRVLKVGERIVSINGQSAHRITHNQCAQMLRSPNLDVQLEVIVLVAIALKYEIGRTGRSGNAIYVSVSGEPS